MSLERCAENVAVNLVFKVVILHSVSHFALAELFMVPTQVKYQCLLNISNSESLTLC